MNEENKTVVIEMDDWKVKAKSKAQKAKEWAATKLHQGADWVRDHKEEAVTLATCAVAGGKMLYGMHRRHQQSAELKWHERHVYDPSTGIYLPIRKPLKGRDAVKFTEMRKAGYSATEALRAMGLLKY